MPIHNEDAAGVFARLQAMYEGLRAAGAIGAFEFFVLSDSTDPDAWIAEEAATPPTRAATSPISAAAGAAATTTWSCSTPTA
jgi:membrane glycosyltransferase